MINSMAYCGLLCEGCPIHLATLEEDREARESMRKSIAGMCYENYGLNLQVSDVTDCDGCKAGTGRLFSGCKTCEIRLCAMRKGIDNCALCPDFECDNLDKIFHEDRGAKGRLHKIRQMHQV